MRSLLNVPISATIFSDIVFITYHIKQNKQQNKKQNKKKTKQINNQT